MVRGKKSAAQDAAAEGRISATVSQSRFHTEAITTASKEVLIQDLSLSIGEHEVLSHAKLHLEMNKHYVLVGRNGTGKSTLLSALAGGLIPGVRADLKILLLGQTAQAEDSNDQEGLTVLQTVLKSDIDRQIALSEVERLTKAIDRSDNPLQPVRSVRQIKHEQLQRQYEIVSRIAEHRSGARGLKARKEQIAMEAELVASEARLAEADDEIDANAIQEETASAVDLLADRTSYLSLSGSDSAESRAKTILIGLGFSAEVIEAPYKNLSGGWRTRATLACALFRPCDILLLDECTNFLDLPAILWLQDHLNSLTDTTFVVTSHDRAFADAVAENILILREQVIIPFHGTVTTYEREQRKKTKWLTRMKAAQDRQKEHMQSSIQSNLSAAKKQGDDKKLKQAASRKKKLEERTGMQVSAKGGRWKLNRDLAGYYTTMRAEIDIPKADPTVRMDLPAVELELKPAGALVSVENVSFRYARNREPQLKEATFVLHPSERVGLVGLNGAGKSTFVKLLLGPEWDATEGLKPTTGTVQRHPRARVGYFTQHAVEALESMCTEQPEITALKAFAIATRQTAEGDEGPCRAALSAVGLPGRLASDVRVRHLSGGQKVRLALAIVVADLPHLLVLDEVTTHLDADTVVALADTLKTYKGAIVVISHDRYFIRAVVEGDDAFGEGDEDTDESDEDDEAEGWQAKEGRVYRVALGRLKLLAGGVQEYEEICMRRVEKMKRNASK